MTADHRSLKNKFMFNQMVTVATKVTQNNSSIHPLEEKKQSEFIK